MWSIVDWRAELAPEFSAWDLRFLSSKFRPITVGCKVGIGEEALELTFELEVVHLLLVPL